MSKQNRIAPKYILLAPSQPEQPRRKQPLKKRTMPAKRQPAFDKTAPALWQVSKTSIRKETLQSPSRETGKQIQSIRGQLAQCMSAIQEQSRKNVVLKELIKVVGEQMAVAVQVEKHAQEVEVEETLKHAHKVEYDIEQILQKHNEEVAKINTLKEQVAAARSDRVVFSNLFRKLQKEIKHSEEYYRSLTINTEINRQRKAERELKQRDLANQQQISLDEIEPKEEPVQPSVTKIPTKTLTAPACKFFLTSPQPVTSYNKKASYRSPQQSECSSQRLKYMIESVETKIQKLAKTGECGNCAEAIEFYMNVEEENERLVGLVLQEERKIEAVQEEIARLQMERRISEVYESRQIAKLENLASTRKIRSIKHIRTIATEETEKHDQDTAILAKVIDILDLPHDHTVEFLIGSDDTMSALQGKLEALFSANSFKKADSSLSNLSAEHDLDNLLSKMQRFQSCDRILNRKQFYTEYIREVSRNKRSLRRK